MGPQQDRGPIVIIVISHIFLRSACEMNHKNSDCNTNKTQDHCKGQAKPFFDRT